MSRALVLGGGGPVGIAWEAGLIVGLAGKGVELSRADAVIGTSAGSVVGARLAQRLDMTDAVRQLTEAVARAPEAGDTTAGMEALMSTLAEMAADDRSPDEVRQALGQLALTASTLGEDQYLELFADLVGQRWPPGFSCTAVDVMTGEFVVWDAAAGVALQSAVASSCSVPGVYPPVTIKGRRYMDGGMRSALNADLAAGHDRAVVVSVMALSLPEGMADPLLERLLQQVGQELESARSSGTRLVIVEPAAEFLEVSGWGLHLMDASRVEAAYQAGVRQGDDESARVQPIWAG